ncbi:MAG: outer membrane beta-barrel domain-containing protein [Gammaproteobacteria bacterium]|nr:outer membrane beta-barrel domain-containing protein [Gammaproteobacteria bacterium]
MENRLQHIFLSICLLVVVLVGFTPTTQAATDPSALELEPLVVREPERRKIDIDRLDTEDWEVGVFAGLMNVEDFGTDTLTGVRIAYHVTEDFFVEAQYGMTDLGQTSFERLSGGAQLLTDDQREMSYYNLSVGYNVFPGESFIASRWAFKGGLYVIAGIGSTDFAGDERFTLNVGLGYRLIATDWLAFHFNVRDHIFDSDLLGREETLHNIEFSGGLTIFF